MARVFLIQTPC